MPKDQVVKKGFYYLTSTWEFRYASSEKEAQAKKPVKYWRVDNFEDFDAALEEAGAIHCERKGIKISKIPVVMS